MVRKVIVLKFVGLVAVLGLMAGVPSTAAAGATPRAVVEEFHGALIGVMRDAEKLKFAGRYQVLAPAMQSNFYLPLMIRVATGTSWRRATPEQKSALVDAFTRMSVSTYASRFNGYGGETFETVREREGPQKTILVETRLNVVDDDPVTLTYVTKKVGEEWRIVDVLLTGGISELAVRHSEYRKILRDSGIAGLVDRLNKKSAALAAAP